MAEMTPEQLAQGIVRLILAIGAKQDLTGAQDAAQTGAQVEDEGSCCIGSRRHLRAALGAGTSRAAAVAANAFVGNDATACDPQAWVSMPQMLVNIEGESGWHTTTNA